MDKAAEHELLDELLELKEARVAYLDADVTSSPVERYLCADRFRAEQASLFRTLPLIAAHGSELPAPDSFLCRQISGLPVLLTRDSDDTVHAFLNVCRHRGSRLVNEEAGCQRRFACPYHAWTWDNRGVLKGVPHEQQGFPGLDKATLGLQRLDCKERFGWIWLGAGSNASIDPPAFLDGLTADFDWLDAGALKVAHTDTQMRAANWKILVEGGLESYHFRIAHRETIGPYFQDNLSSYRMFGPHSRSVLPRVSLTDLQEQPREDWSLRRVANLVYAIFPTTQLLVQDDHIVSIQMEPVAPDRTQLRLSTLVPADADLTAEDEARHWRRNHDITMHTLSEDFDIGESIQAGLSSGANTHLTFGRFEGALARFNRTIEDMLHAAA